MVKKRPWKVQYVKNNKWHTKSFGSQKTSLDFTKKLKKAGKRYSTYLDR